MPEFFLSLTLCLLGIFYRLVIFAKSTSSKIYFRNTIRVSNRLDQDQDRHCVGPDLCQNCLQRTTLVDIELKKLSSIWILFIGLDLADYSG